MQRKAATDKQTPPKPRNSQKAMKNVDSYTEMTDPNSMAMDYELDDSLQNDDMQLQKHKRPKRPTKSVNENLEPAFTNSTVIIEQTQYQPHLELGPGGLRAGGKDDTPLHTDSLT